MTTEEAAAKNIYEGELRSFDLMIKKDWTARKMSTYQNVNSAVHHMGLTPFRDGGVVDCLRHIKVVLLLSTDFFIERRAALRRLEKQYEEDNMAARRGTLGLEKKLALRWRFGVEKALRSLRLIGCMKQNKGMQITLLDTSAATKSPYDWFDRREVKVTFDIYGRGDRYNIFSGVVQVGFDSVPSNTDHWLNNLTGDFVLKITLNKCVRSNFAGHSDRYTVYLNWPVYERHIMNIDYFNTVCILNAKNINNNNNNNNNNNKKIKLTPHTDRPVVLPKKVTSLITEYYLCGVKNVDFFSFKKNNQ